MYEEKFGHAVAEEVVSEMALSSFSEQELTLTSLVPMVQHLCLWHLTKDMQRSHNSFAEQEPTLASLIRIVRQLWLGHLGMDTKRCTVALSSKS